MRIFIERLERLAPSEPEWSIFINPTITLEASRIVINGKSFEYYHILRAAIDDKVEIFKEALVWRNRTKIGDDTRIGLASADLGLHAATFFMENLAQKMTIDILGHDVEIPDDTDIEKYARKLLIQKAKRNHKNED